MKYHRLVQMDEFNLTTPGRHVNETKSGLESESSLRTSSEFIYQTFMHVEKKILNLSPMCEIIVGRTFLFSITIRHCVNITGLSHTDCVTISKKLLFSQHKCSDAKGLLTGSVWNFVVSTLHQHPPSDN